jgi:hypothetical protein
VIAERYGIGAGIKKFFGESGRNTRTRRAIFGIYYNSVNPALIFKTGNFTLENLSPGRTHYIAYHQYLHRSDLPLTLKFKIAAETEKTATIRRG